jgi:hypothetical protein
VLVCRVPREQIAVQAEDLRSANVVLLSGESLSNAFDSVRFPGDPDALLDQAIKDLRTTMRD